MKSICVGWFNKVGGKAKNDQDRRSVSFKSVSHDRNQLIASLMKCEGLTYKQAICKYKEWKARGFK